MPTPTMTYEQALKQHKKYYYTNEDGEIVYYNVPRSKVDWLIWNGIDDVITDSKYDDDVIQSIRERIWDENSQSYDKSKLTDEDRLNLYDSVERIRAERGNAPGWNQMQSYEEYLGNAYSDAQLSEWANRNEYAVEGGDFSDDDAFYSWDRNKHPEHYYKYYNGLLPDDYDETGNNLLRTDTGEVVGSEPQFMQDAIETPVEPIEQTPAYTEGKLLSVPKFQRRGVSEPEFEPEFEREILDIPVEPVEQIPVHIEEKISSLPKIQRLGVSESRFEPEFEPETFDIPIEPIEQKPVYTEQPIQPVQPITPTGNTHHSFFGPSYLDTWRNANVGLAKQGTLGLKDDSKWRDYFNGQKLQAGMGMAGSVLQGVTDIGKSAASLLDNQDLSWMDVQKDNVLGISRGPYNTVEDAARVNHQLNAFQPDLDVEDVREKNLGERLGTVGSMGLSGLTAGMAFGPIGGAVGYGIGTLTGLVADSIGQQEARDTLRGKKINYQLATLDAQKNVNAGMEGINHYNFRNAVADRKAMGGPIHQQTVQEFAQKVLKKRTDSRTRPSRVIRERRDGGIVIRFKD